MMQNPLTVVLLFSLLAMASCHGDETPPVQAPDMRARYPEFVQIAEEIAIRCPVVATDDVQARDTCSAELRDLSPLHEASEPLVYWGGHKPEHTSYDPATHSLTEFDRQVWRTTYAGQFMFSGEYEIFEAEDHWVIVKLESQWRAGMPLGELPYPFTHSADKVTAHEQSTHVLLVADQATRKIRAAYRYGADETRELSNLGPFDGQWTWVDEFGEQQPRVSRFDYVLSAGNPHLSELETSWALLFEAVHANGCDGCHTPSNPSEMALLRILNIPAQTWSAAVADVGGDTLTSELREATMPPGGGLSGEAAAELLPRAEDFEMVAKAAKAWEDEEHARRLLQP